MDDYEPGVLAVPVSGTKHLRTLEMPDLSKVPKDKIGEEIVLLIALHPQLNVVFGATLHIDVVCNIVNTLGVKSKKKVLHSLREQLGIKPLKRRALPYVGE